jgi:hypothetical protein
VARLFIGRGLTCNAKIDDPLLSKVQCSVFYNPMSGWTLVDGDYALQRPSTNGTWLYLSENFEVYSGMVFRANQTLFQVMPRQVSLL